MRDKDLYASPFGVAYSAYMERPWLSRRVSRTVWGGDTQPYYALMEAAGEVPTGGAIVDCPCGAGPALRAIPPAVAYVGVDLSAAMLGRARKRAAVRGLAAAEFVEARAEAMPLPTEHADLFFSFWGLHCFADPAAALREAARVLKPGGRLVGASFLRGRETLRQRFLIRPGVGGFGPMGTQSEIESWLADAGLELVVATRSGPFLFFDASKPILGRGVGEGG
ncbi:MAG TPA: class I SAM-dependent methyltransferase [Solirubrobacterales bacterium]|nr:class I SAM-dependent methyltransferase [Solirubrobacterales bacterium]